MDADRFDWLARSLTTTRSRRGLTRLLGGLGLGGVLSVWGATETLGAKRGGGTPCTKGSQCKTGKCIGIPGHKTCSCSTKVTCAAGSSCLHGGCFRGASCAAECSQSSCGPGFVSCFCSETVGGVPVCYGNENFCTEGKTCNGNRDCPTGRACVDVSCVGCSTAVAAVCLAPCPVSP